MKWEKTSCRVSNIKNSFIKRLFEMATETGSAKNITFLLLRKCVNM